MQSIGTVFKNQPIKEIIMCNTMSGFIINMDIVAESIAVKP